MTKNIINKHNKLIDRLRAEEQDEINKVKEVYYFKRKEKFNKLLNDLNLNDLNIWFAPPSIRDKNYKCGYVASYRDINLFSPVCDYAYDDRCIYFYETNKYYDNLEELRKDAMILKLSGE